MEGEDHEEGVTYDCDGAISRSVPPIPAWVPAVRPSRAWWWSLAGLIALTTAGQIGLIVAAGYWLRALRLTVAGTPELVPGSGRRPRSRVGRPGGCPQRRAPGPEAPYPIRADLRAAPAVSRAPRPPRDNGAPSGGRAGGSSPVGGGRGGSSAGSLGAPGSSSWTRPAGGRRGRPSHGRWPLPGA